MWVAEIWRYPVKSMAGEPLEAAEVRAAAGPEAQLVRYEGIER
jgi:uncharacterized protein YcbX